MDLGGWLLLVACVADLVLASVVLRKVGHLRAGRFLGASLLLHGLLLAVLPAVAILGPPHASGGWARFLDWRSLRLLVAPWLLAAIAATDLSFALSYPGRLRGARRDRRLIAGLYAAPALLLAGALAAFFVPGADDPRLGLPFPSSRQTLATVLLMLGVAAVFAATLGYIGVFRWRARNGATALERRRSRYMMKAVGIPLIVAIGGILLAVGVALLIDRFAHDPALEHLFAEGIAPVFVMVFAFVPPLAIAFGMLRYRILDFDEKLRGTGRFALGRGLVGLFFLLVFFAVSEGLEALTESRTGSAVAGILVAAVLTITLTPLHHATTRLARRVFPGQEGVVGQQDQYRAMYEDLTIDGPMSAGERRLLDALGEKMGLEASIRRGIERDVETERLRSASAPARARPGAA